MTPESRSGLWTVLLIVVVTVCGLLVIAALDRAGAFN